MVTSEQVARLAGVSRATVSRALNGSGSVSAQARQRVQEAILSLGYEPDVVAQSLVSQRSHTLAFCLFADASEATFTQLGQTQRYFYLDLLKYVEQEVDAAGYDLLLPSRPLGRSPENYVRSLRTRRVAGVLALGLGQSDPRTQALVNANIPTVFLDGLGQGPHATHVTSENAMGSQLATVHLLELGHRRIAIFPGNSHGLIGMERLMGCQRALAHAGLELDPDLIWSSGWNTEDAYQAMVSLLTTRRDFTAILAGNDLMALGMLRALHEHGIRIPEDVSIVGFDDVDLCRYMEPPLTTVRQDREAMGRTAVHQLIAMIEEDVPATPAFIPTQVIVRASTGPVRQEIA